MMRLNMALLVIVVLTQAVVAAPIPTDEKFDIKLNYTPKAGEVSIEKRYTKSVATFKYVDAQGAATGEAKETEIKTFEYERTILKVEDKKAIKFAHKYTKASIEKFGQKREPSYLNRTITFERKDGKLEITADKGPAIVGEDLEDLRKEAEDTEGEKFNRAMEPGKLVKVGDTWDHDGKKLVAAFNTDKKLEVEDTSKVTIKLVKAPKRDKQQFVVLDATFDLQLKSLEGLTLLGGTSYTLKGTVEACIDGTSSSYSSKMEGPFKMKGIVESGGAKYNFEGEGIVEEEKSSVVKSK